MDEDALNTSLRKFLKKLGVTAQREIEKAVRRRYRVGLTRRTRSTSPARSLLNRRRRSKRATKARTHTRHAVVGNDLINGEAGRPSMRELLDGLLCRRYL
jgi:hypothetical protein